MSHARVVVVGPALVLAGALLHAPAPAAAECATPLWPSLPDGGEVPTRGVFYLRNGYLAAEGRWIPPELEWSGLLPGFAYATQVGPQVVRIDYAGPAGARLTVRDTWHEPTVELAAGWRPASESPRVLLFSHRKPSGDQGCGDGEELTIQLDQAVAAIRVHWTAGAENIELLEAPQPVGLLSVLHLGETSCGPANVALEVFRQRGELELHAIHFDGTEQWIRGMPRDFALADAPAVPLRVDLIGVDQAHPALTSR